jgi:hypothetical protein
MRALCNTCLRVKEFFTYAQAHSTDCQCGATAEKAEAFCACPGCQQTALDLERGGRCAASVSGTFENFKLTSWSAEAGAA